ncbi:alpha/beta hydrolase fold domain-containing protein [Actinomadura scrupuli]|uniref:alpha/beta hydrolase fold domain-containing protein n=1 Tax=Actinomadura scrupuli TaxID=559629 RepID=UPI003D96E63E
MRPPGPVETVVLYLRGDRDLSGTPHAALDLAAPLALRTGAAVVCARHRPTFPAALEDVQAAYRHCRASGPVVVAGERAGAGLVAALLIRLRDLGAPLPRRAVLVSALLDLTLEAPSLSLNAGADPTFDVVELRRHVTRYAAGSRLADPLVSPLFANLHGLPPVQLLTAGTDPLLDDSLAFAARAARSGVTVDLRVLPDATTLHQEAVATMAPFLAGDRPDTHGGPGTATGRGDAERLPISPP